MHIGFTGTQQGMTSSQKERLMRLLLGTALFVEFHHGGCVGGDAEAHEVARELGFNVHVHPSTVVSKRAHCVGASVVYEPKPPLVRNRDIVDVTEVLFAAPRSDREELRNGTWATVRYAKRVGRRVVMVYP